VASSYELLLLGREQRPIHAAVRLPHLKPRCHSGATPLAWHDAQSGRDSCAHDWSRVLGLVAPDDPQCWPVLLRCENRRLPPPRQVLEAVGVEQRTLEFAPLICGHLAQRRAADDLPDAAAQLGARPWRETRRGLRLFLTQPGLSGRARRLVGDGPVGLRLVGLLLVAENDGAWCPSATAAAKTAARASATAAAREASATAASAAADARTAAKAFRKTRFVETAATTAAADA
jgi:hypothetical protein